MGKGTRPTYGEEFKQEVVRLARTSGQSQKAIAAELGMSDRQLRRWLKGLPDPADAQAVQVATLTAMEKAELRKLRRENRILKEEQEILRKATAFFAKETR